MARHAHLVGGASLAVGADRMADVAARIEAFATTGVLPDDLAQQMVQADDALDDVAELAMGERRRVVPKRGT